MSIAQTSLGARPAAAAHGAVVRRGKKRPVEDDEVSRVASETVINRDFLKNCEETYRSNPVNETLRNVITMFGADLASTSDAKSRLITHQFVNTYRRPHYKTMDQENSGRCWMYAGMNIIRPFIMAATDSKANIKFSGAYLFFYDKLERSRTFLLQVLDSIDLGDEERPVETIMKTCLSDGGYFDFFINLVTKYGLVPDTAMPETALSGYSSEMNDQLEERLRVTAFKLRHDRLTAEERTQLIDTTLQSIYNDLAKCLGVPPKKFDWTITLDEGKTEKFVNLTPHYFLKLCSPRGLKYKDKTLDFDYSRLVTLAHVPYLGYNKLFEIEGMTNIYGARNYRFLNVSARDFELYTKEQLTITPVGMACHVGRDFSRFHAAIDPDLVDNTRVFDPQPTLSKGERIRAFILDTNHAMTFTGIDFDKETGEMTQLEIENSWGHYDSDEPILDGFISMSRKAFEEDCTQVVVLTDILPNNLIRILGSKPEKLEPWSAMAESMRIPGTPPNVMTRPLRVTSALRTKRS